ncbi:MAG TPA: hypothetical protein VGR49_07010 [Actinomycetota bacterium]|jgi:hypothetical protein|nr:hypothetical protein [Actinomycetota bacterium]
MARTWLVLVLTLGLSLVPVGLVLADPPAHSNAGGKKNHDSSLDEGSDAPSQGEESPDGSADGGEAPDSEPSGEEAPGNQGSGNQGSGGGGGAPADEGPAADEPGSDQAAADDAAAADEAAGNTKKEKAAKGKPQDAAKPPGNNGTVKVDGREFDTHPNNEPHPGCDFQIDFYGYDEGDLTADIFFTLQAPSGSGPLASRTDIFIGEDPAGGGTDLDAEEYFDLSDALAASGAYQHPIQGYHIKLTVHAEGSIGADVKHKVFWVKCEEQGGQFSELVVTKVWLDEEGNEVDPPEDLSPSFRIVITNPDNGTSLTCRVEDDGDLDCTGDLVVADGDDVTVTEINAPEGWIGPGTATAECVTTQEGNDTFTTCEIEVVNAFTGGGGGQTFTIEVEKVWLDEEGNPTSPPEDLPEGFQIIITGEDGSLTCTVDEETGDAHCEGDLVVEDGDEVSVEEVNAPEGWLGPDEATAECETTTTDENTHTACTIEIVNIPQVLGIQEIRRIEKVWLDEDGNEVAVPEDLPAGFTLILEDPDEGGRLECTYEGANLRCTGQIQLEDGETLVVDEENAPEGWSGPQSVPVDCVTVEGEDGTITTCTVRVVNEFSGGGRPPEVLPRGPTTPGVLAVTGIEAEGLLALAIALLGSGAAVLAAERRRRRASR